MGHSSNCRILLQAMPPKHDQPPQSNRGTNVRREAGSNEQAEYQSTATEEAPKLDSEHAAQEADFKKAQQEIEAIRKRLVRKDKAVLQALRLRWHPDKNILNQAVATIVFQFVQSEWEKFD